jgi:urease accessory protein UreH
VLVRRHHTWPYAVGRVFTEPTGTASVIVQSGSGGIITGDRLRQRLSAQDGAQARVLGQGAMSVHRRGREAGSGEDLELVAGPGSRLENLAEPRLLHHGSELEQRTVVRLEGGTVLTLESVVVIGADAVYDSLLEVHDHGELAARERMRFTSADLPAGSSAFGLLVCAGPDAGPAADDPAWRAWSARAGSASAYGAVSALPHVPGVGVRVVARDGAGLRSAMDAALEVLR